jgi:hypothetical protein
MLGRPRHGKMLLEQWTDYLQVGKVEDLEDGVLQLNYVLEAGAPGTLKKWRAAAAIRTSNHHESLTRLLFTASIYHETPA